MTATEQPVPAPVQELGQLLDTIDELVGFTGEGQLEGRGLRSLARRCRTALGADVVLIALRQGGWPEVVSDAGPDVDTVELRRQMVLAQASLDDPVIDHPPGLPGPGDGHRPSAVVVHHPLRRLVADLPRRDHLCGTLTVCRRLPFAADEVELAMAFAGLAALVVAQTGCPAAAPAEAHERPDTGPLRRMNGSVQP